MISVIISSFYYLIELHYSQTHLTIFLTIRMFYYLIELHYSQTNFSYRRPFHVFYYLIELHYSQTNGGMVSSVTVVLLPYRITLLSNPFISPIALFIVLLPYRITLLSNGICSVPIDIKFYYLIELHYSQTLPAFLTKLLIVLLPYRITLLSNRYTYSP